MVSNSPSDGFQWKQLLVESVVQDGLMAIMSGLAVTYIGNKYLRERQESLTPNTFAAKAEANLLSRNIYLAGTPAECDSYRIHFRTDKRLQTLANTICLVVSRQNDGHYFKDGRCTEPLTMNSLWGAYRRCFAKEFGRPAKYVDKKMVTDEMREEAVVLAALKEHYDENYAK